MKALLAFLSLLFLSPPVVADGVSMHPAAKTPAEMVAEPAPTTRPSWEPAPGEISARYLAIVQDRLGHLGTAEAEARAQVEVQSAQIEKMKKVIADLQTENTTLKTELATRKK